VEVCHKATLHVVVITKRITRDVVISLKLSINNGDPELKNCSTKGKICVISNRKKQKQLIQTLVRDC